MPESSAAENKDLPKATTFLCLVKRGICDLESLWLFKGLHYKLMYHWGVFLPCNIQFHKINPFDEEYLKI